MIILSDLGFTSVPLSVMPQGCTLTPNLILFMLELRFLQLLVGAIRVHLGQIQKMQQERNSHYCGDYPKAQSSKAPLILWDFTEHFISALPLKDQLQSKPLPVRRTQSCPASGATVNKEVLVFEHRQTADLKSRTRALGLLQLHN